VPLACEGVTSVYTSLFVLLVLLFKFGLFARLKKGF